MPARRRLAAAARQLPQPALVQCCHAKAAPGQAPEAQGAVPSPAGSVPPAPAEPAPAMQASCMAVTGCRKTAVHTVTNASGRCGWYDVREVVL